MRNINDYLLNRHTPNGRTYPRLDCWGLVVDIYRENLGIELNEYTDLSGKNMSEGFQNERQAGRFVEVKEPQNYDVVAFFIHARLFHVGVWLNGRILHTSERRNTRYEKLDTATQAHRRYYRYAEH